MEQTQREAFDPGTRTATARRVAANDWRVYLKYYFVPHSMLLSRHTRKNAAVAAARRWNEANA